MIKGLSYNLIIYTFVVFMVLLRPFCAYRISMNDTYSNNPGRIYSLLQRLVKKKETHADDYDEAAEILQSTELEIILPFVLLALFNRKAAWLLSLLLPVSINWDRNTIFRVFAPNQYYQLISRLQI